MDEIEQLALVRGKRIVELEAKVERLEKEIQTEINYHSGTDNHYRAERLKAALLEGKQDG